MTANPYADGYDAYWSQGWRGILPLPYGKKWPPPDNYTGYDGAYPSYPDCAAWAEAGPNNLALRLSPTEVGLDVDDYDGRTGGSTLRDLIAKYGPLPKTWISTSRTDGTSGIRVYSIPAGTTLPTKFPGIEMIQYHHRYLVAAPSIHPSGARYEWVDEATGERTTEPPNVADLPALPQAWIDGLAIEARANQKVDLDLSGAMTVLSEMPGGEPCAHVLAHAGKALAGGDRHDSYNAAVLAVVGAGRRGCPGARAVVARLHAAFVSEIAGPGGRATKAEAEAEWQRGLVGALGLVAAEVQGGSCPDEVAEYVAGLMREVEAEPTDAPAEDAPGDAEEAPQADDLPAGLRRAIDSEFARLVVVEAARDKFNTHRAGQAAPLEGIDLGAFLAQADEEERYRVADLWPSEGRILLAAAAKSGKTTLVVGNLVPSLVDGRPFLGRFDVEPVSGRVGILNMEVGERTLRAWLGKSGIQATDRVILYNLRGKSSTLTLASEAGRKRLAERLRADGIEVAILDPLAPVLASLGLDENSNADVARFFAWWSEVLGLAGIVDDLVVHHTGHAGERSRGASRLLDEPDAIWTLTKAKDKEATEDDPFGHVGERSLAAYGRDVELPESVLRFDRDTGGLEITNLRPGKSGATGDKRRKAILSYLASAPGGVSKNDIDRNVTGTRADLFNAVDDMVARHEIAYQHGLYYLWISGSEPVPNRVVPGSLPKGTGPVPPVDRNQDAQTVISGPWSAS